MKTRDGLEFYSSADINGYPYITWNLPDPGARGRLTLDEARLLFDRLGALLADAQGLPDKTPKVTKRRGYDRVKIAAVRKPYR